MPYPLTRQIRRQLPNYDYVMVASTHNHEGPDTIGIWGPSPFQRGVDDSYLNLVVERCIEAVQVAEKNWFRASAEYGIAQDDSLLRDSREPYIKDGVLRALRFLRPDGSVGGAVVQWNCHPETLGSGNTLLTADFPAFAIKRLNEQLRCPVFYFSGAVGGLMRNPSDRIREGGPVVPDGNFEYARQYGEAVADLALGALAAARPVALTPISVRSQAIAIPVENPLFKAARELGILNRPVKVWEGNGKDLPGAADRKSETRKAVESEVAYLRFGEVHVACIPGELYPELVYGGIIADDPGSDFPKAEIEPTITAILPSDQWFLIGLANDELGYLIPKRQWDEKPPFCFGRQRAQYGEQNSCGPDAAPLIMRALRTCVAEAAN